MSMFRMARGAGRQLIPTVQRLFASGTSAPGSVLISAEACLARGPSSVWSSAAPITATVCARGFAAPAQEAASAAPSDSRVQPLTGQVEDEAKAGKASAGGGGDGDASGVMSGGASTSSADNARASDRARHASGAVAEVLRNTRLQDTGSPVMDGKTPEAPPPSRSQGSYWLMQPVYRTEYVEGIKPKHLPPSKLRERLALTAINLVRSGFDFVSGYGPNMTEKLWLRRIIYLETVAGVPGMVAGMLRHLHSLRRMKRDHGWIHTLVEEAENERMHLLTFLELRQPGYLFRASVLIAQGVFFNFYFLAYLISPKFCHSFVGYLEEEAVKTYTRSIEDLDAGKLPEWEKTAAPGIAKKYWKLGEDAGMRELLLAVRADEAGHSHVNHVLSKMQPDEDNPFEPGSHEVP